MPTFGKHDAFLVAGFCSADYLPLADRLAASCTALNLPCAIHEVPRVHSSISPRGGDDLRFTKANFVRFMLDCYRMPVLYIDVDCVVVSQPGFVTDLAGTACDFAIYNWFADERNDAYEPVAIDVVDAQGIRTDNGRFYQFSHSVEEFSLSQLCCSGMVQYYNDSPAARALLADWQQAISEHPGVCDDECLDYAFNNFPPNRPGLSFRWLDKAYARYPWWIHVSPVINHPQVPLRGHAWRRIEESGAKRRFYRERLERLTRPTVFPRDCLIDTRDKVLYRTVNGAWVPAWTFSRELWL